MEHWARRVMTCCSSSGCIALVASRCCACGDVPNNAAMRMADADAVVVGAVMVGAVVVAVVVVVDVVVWGGE